MGTADERAATAGGTSSGSSSAAVSRPDATLATPDLAAIESMVRRAIDERRPDLLTLVGNGEFSIAMRWTSGGHDWVVKRVPPFPSREKADDYVAVTLEYIGMLRDRGVRCVTTDLHVVDRPGGSAVVYHAQPLLDVDNLVSNILRRTDPTDGHPVVGIVLDQLVHVTADGVGFDAQFANWYWFEGEPWQFDFSTPLQLDERKVVRFDTTGFLREYPLPVRWYVYKELMKLAPQFGDTRFVLQDVLAQLHRERMEQWCAPVMAYARERHGYELSLAEAEAKYREEIKFFPALLKIKRAQRTWLQRTGRRYDTLLPTKSAFD